MARMEHTLGGVRGGIGLASGLVLVAGACHSGLRVPRDAALEQSPAVADRQGSDAPPSPPDIALVDTVDVPPVDARWRLPDGAGPICWQMIATSEWAWADVVTVIDRSTSMGLSLGADVPCEPGAGDCTTRWDAVRSALLGVVLVEPHFRWGTQMFPSPGAASCEVAPAPEVPMLEDAAEAIDRALGSASPGGDAPTAAAIRAATAYLAGLADQDYKAMMLFTDGEPGCGSVDGGSGWDEALAAAAVAQAQGYPIFVFGLGPNPGDLDRLAKAGGTERYFPATSRQQLETALGSLFWHGDSRSCTFVGSQPPPDPALVYVFINGEPIPYDGIDGWSFGWMSSTIVLNGRSCELTLTLNPVEVAVLAGCGDAGSP
jgi:hypothetical protein